jgi:hypothetical protein
VERVVGQILQPVVPRNGFESARRLNKSNRRTETAIWLLVTATALSTLNGCGPRSDRRAVSGQVTLDGVPLDGGTIQFKSLDAKKMTASGAMVRDGEYTIPQEKGLVPGTYHLEIYAPDSAAKPVIYRSAPGAPGVLTQPERIPAEYNVESRKTIEVTADGVNRFDFAIINKSVK